MREKTPHQGILLLLHVLNDHPKPQLVGWRALLQYLISLKTLQLSHRSSRTRAKTNKRLQRKERGWATPYSLMSLTWLAKRLSCRCSGFKQAISRTIATEKTSCLVEASNVGVPQKHSIGM